MDGDSCYSCRKIIAKNQHILCRSCELVLYCCEKCLLKDMDEHKGWCQEVQLYMLTKDDYDGELLRMEIDEAEIDEDAYSPFFARMWLLSRSNSSSPEVINNWKEYFVWRKYNGNPLLCSGLQWLMTTYFVIKQFFKDNGVKKKLLVHVVGVEKEVNFLCTFAELEDLLPDTEIEILFVGPHVSQSNSNTTLESKQVKCSVVKSNYHEINSIAKPDLVIGFNAGLPAYLDWMPTINHLKNNNIPSYFTEYCWRSYHLTVSGLSLLGGISISTSMVNPFRSPIRVHDSSSKIPQYSNHIIFKLQYDAH